MSLIILRLKKQGKSLEDFTYESEYITEEIYSAMNATNFIGVSVSSIVFDL